MYPDLLGINRNIIDMEGGVECRHRLEDLLRGLQPPHLILILARTVFGRHRSRCLKHFADRPRTQICDAEVDYNPVRNLDSVDNGWRHVEAVVSHAKPDRGCSGIETGELCRTF